MSCWFPHFNRCTGPSTETSAITGGTAAARSAAWRTEPGYAIRKAHYSNFIGFFGWWTNSHILKREAQSERQIEVFDRYVVPLMSAVERRARAPFGQSLVAVLEKP